MLDQIAREAIPPNPADNRAPSEIPKWFPLPLGITIEQLRRQVPTTASLRIQFQRVDPMKQPILDPIVIDVPNDRQYILDPRAIYEVNSNSDEKSNEVFLNPVRVPEGVVVPEESNISKAVDIFLASAAGRTARENILTILISSPDSDIEVALKTLSQKMSDVRTDEIMRDFDRGYEKIQKEKLEKIFNQSVAQTSLNLLEKGEFSLDVWESMVTWDAEILYINALLEGKGISTEEAMEKASFLFFTKLKKVIDKRVPELRKRVKNKSEMAFSLDKYDMDDENAQEGMPIIVFYIPQFGWSVSIPNGNCPAAAVRSFDAVLEQNQPKGSVDEIFLKTLAAEGEALELDRDNKIVVYRKRNKIDQNNGVYHPGHPVKDALDTIHMLGHPTDIREPFKRIIFKDSSELVIEKGESISLMQEFKNKKDT